MVVRIVRTRTLRRGRLSGFHRALEFSSIMGVEHGVREVESGFVGVVVGCGRRESVRTLRQTLWPEATCLPFDGQLAEELSRAEAPSDGRCGNLQVQFNKSSSGLQAFSMTGCR